MPVQANSAAADAWAEIQVIPDQTDVWITFDILFAAAALAYWVANFGSPDLCSTIYSDDTTVLNLVYVTTDPTWNSTPGPVEGGGTPTADTWQTVEFHRIQDGTCDVYVNDEIVASGDDTSGTPTTFVRVGLYQSFADASQMVLIRNFKVGTARGSSDLLPEGFDTEDLDTWTNLSGDVTIVSDPVAPTSLAISTAPGLDATTFTVRRTVS